MRNEGLMGVVLIDGYFMEHDKEFVVELLQMVAKALGTGLTIKAISGCDYTEIEIAPAAYQREALEALQVKAFRDNPNLNKELTK